MKDENIYLTYFNLNENWSGWLDKWTPVPFVYTSLDGWINEPL